MKIIRGETIQEVVLLTSTGELIPTLKEEAPPFLEEELNKSFQKGVEKGEQLGFARARAENKVFVDLLRTMTRKIMEQKNRLLDQIKPEIIEFALAVCERVIRKELTQPQAFVRLLNALLVSATPSLQGETLHIMLSPDDYLMLEGHFHQIHYDKREIEGVRFVSDPLMRRGDCRIEAKSGLLNYDIARELEELQAKVLRR